MKSNNDTDVQQVHLMKCSQVSANLFGLFRVNLHWKNNTIFVLHDQKSGFNHLVCLKIYFVHIKQFAFDKPMF